jgi:D-arabinose 1-dehydrogenase-like Zn-dependent alcohol dehydrogenase
MKNLDFGMPSVLKNVELKGAFASARSAGEVTKRRSTGSTMGSLAEFKEAVSFIDKHQIVPVVHTVLPGLDKIEDGFQLMDKAGQFGKICVAIAGSSSSSSSKL